LLKTSDIISVSVPLSKETTHLLSAREFSICKDGVIIVNTARGKVIDEAALVKALESGKVAAVGLDVFEQVKKNGMDVRLTDSAHVATKFFFPGTENSSWFTQTSTSHAPPACWNQYL
jgi:lactate dehydrogenase-like 2-hydroxyacid dehydrogenase